MEGRVSCRWGSLAKIGSPVADRRPAIAQLLLPTAGFGAGTRKANRSPSGIAAVWSGMAGIATGEKAQSEPSGMIGDSTAGYSGKSSVTTDSPYLARTRVNR